MRSALWRIPRALACTVLLGLAPAALHAQESGEDRTLTIGFVAFLSGPAAGSFGIPNFEGFEFMVDAINAGEVPAPYDTPGIAGARIEYFAVDESGGPTKQVTEFRNMVERRNVDLVMGYISSGDCLAIPPVAEELRQLTILVDCGTPRVFEEADYRYVFRTGPHAAMDNIAAVRYLHDIDPEIATIAGINQNYAWGLDAWADFSSAMGILYPGVESVTEQFPKLFAGQYSTEISALTVRAPEVIHTSLWGADLEAFVLQGAQRGLFMNRHVVMVAADHVLPMLGRNVPDGVIVGARGPHGDFSPDTELANWFRAGFKERYGKLTTQPSHKSAMAILAVKKAFETAAAELGRFPTNEEVIDAFEYLQWDTPSGPVELALGKGHQAIQASAIGVTRWNDEEGRVELVDIKRYAARCVNPPEGVLAVEWIKGGMPGAQCD